MRQRLAIAAIAFVLSSCVGDNAHNVDYVNATTDAVDVFEVGSHGEGYKRLLQPGETFHNQWLVLEDNGKLTGGPRQIEATNKIGDLVFCHRYTYDELDRLSWVIRITAQNDCQPSQ